MTPAEGNSLAAAQHAAEASSVYRWAQHHAVSLGDHPAAGLFGDLADAKLSACLELLGLWRDPPAPRLSARLSIVAERDEAARLDEYARAAAAQRLPDSAAAFTAAADQCRAAADQLVSLADISPAAAAR